jgi:hypothetical protein
VMSLGPDPVIALVERPDGLEDLVFGVDFESDESLTQRPAFVILWANWLQGVRMGLDTLPQGALDTRQSVAGNFRVTGPDGSQSDIVGGFLPGRTGVYFVSDVETPGVPLLGVSLLDRDQSELSVEDGDDREDVYAWLAQGGRAERRAAELAPWFALAALLLLVLEWCLYRRRFIR